jgi:hypothetical protein
MRELYIDLDIVTDMKRSEWIGHVVKMDQGRTVKEICDSKLVGSIEEGEELE